MAELEFRGLRKAFPGGTLAVEDLDLLVADGEFLVLVAPSGSGKTTVLRMAAGLERASSGDVLIGGEVVNDVAPPDRDIAMVFQTYALYPHMSVYDNMAFGLKLHGVKKDQIRPRVQSAAKMLELDDLLKRKPSQLSGGQRQRVAMGRAIVREPAAYLMDEPLSTLDAKLRVQMRTEIQRLQHELGTTTMYVTHDQVGAMTRGDRVGVMRDGRLVQVDTPQVLYARPADLFVAGFIGSPAMNFLRAELEGSNGTTRASFGSHTLELPSRALPPALAERGLRDVIIGVRPEHLDLAVNGNAVLRAPVTLAEPVGAQVIVHLDLETLSVADQGGDFCACLAARRTCTRGETLALGVDPAALHFFDPETETALR